MKFFKANIEYIILSLSFILLAILAILSDGYFEGADNISHFNISRYSFQHPYLFLDHWGKPLFTLLSSPFSQFGFKGLVFFNIICGILTSYFSYRIVKELKYDNAYLICIFVTFSQYYFLMQLTALTEILFSLVLIISVFFALRKKYLVAAILLSFLPFVRNEGIIIFPFFFLFYMLFKQYRAIPFLLTGFLMYSMIGYFQNGDFLWLFHKNPYMNSNYGSGSYLHFLQNMDLILGWPILILSVIGFITFIYQSLKNENRKQFSAQIKAEWLLLVLPFLAYVSFHSYLWGKGIGGSAGLLRVMTGVLPLAAIIALRGFNLFSGALGKWKIPKAVFLVLTTAIFVYTPFYKFHFPVEADSAGRLIKHAAAWVKANGYSGKKIYYYDPMFQPEFGFDPFSSDTNRIFFQLSSFPQNELEVNSIVIWDAHAGPGDGGTPLQKFMESKEFKLLKVFKPDVEFEINGYKYKICIFEKIAFNKNNNNYALEKNLE